MSATLGPARPPAPPCYTVIFTSKCAGDDGRAAWHEAYEVRVAKVERAYGFARDGAG